MSCFCCCDFRGGITCNLVGNIALNIEKHVAVVATLNAILAHTITHSYSCNFARDMTRKIIGITCNLARKIAWNFTSRNICNLSGNIPRNILPTNVTGNMTCNLARNLSVLHEILRVQLQLLSVATSQAILRVTFF